MVSLVMASANQGDELHRTIADAHRSLAGIHHEIIVVDDQSTDGSTRNVDARVISTPCQFGCSMARRLGYNHSCGDVVIVSDPHCRYDGSCLADLARHVHNRRCAAQPRVFLHGHGWTLGGKMFLSERGIRMARVIRRRLRIAGLFGSIYAARRDVWNLIGGWPLLPCVLGRWEELTSLLLARLGVTVDQCHHITAQHIKYRPRHSYPYNVPDDTEAKSLHFCFRVLAPAGYVREWRQLIEAYVGPDGQDVDGPELERLYRLLQDRQIMTEDEMFENAIYDKRSAVPTHGP